MELHRNTSNPPNGRSHFYDIVAPARNDVWFASLYTTYHYDGSAFTEAPGAATVGTKRLWWAPAPFGRPSVGDGYMFGPSSRDLWWAERGGSLLSHWDGTAWYYFQQAPIVWSNGYVAPTGEVFLGGASGHLGRLPATPARVQDRTIETLGRGWDLPAFNGIWSSPEGNVYAVPGPYQLTPDGWTPVTISAGEQFFEGIWGSSASDVLVVGDYGSIAHFDGQAWTRVAGVPQQDAYTLFAVSGTGPNDVWAVGRSGVVGHYDGSGWKFGLKASLSDLHGVWAASPRRGLGRRRQPRRPALRRRHVDPGGTGHVAQVPRCVGVELKRGVGRRRLRLRDALERDHLDADDDLEHGCPPQFFAVAGRAPARYVHLPGDKASAREWGQRELGRPSWRWRWKGP